MTVLVDLIAPSSARTAVDDLLRSIMRDPPGSTSLVRYGERYYCGVVMSEAQWNAFQAAANLRAIGYLISTNKASEERHMLRGNLRATVGQRLDHAQARERGTDWLTVGLMTELMSATF